MNTIMAPSVLSWLAGALLGVSVFLGVLVALVDRSGPVYSAWTRYVDVLDRRLKLLFLNAQGSRIAVVQLALLVLLGALNLLIEMRYGVFLLLIAALGPLLWLERRRRKRLLEIEQQLDPFILALANALKSIPSVSAAFQSIAHVLSSPMREEVELCNREIRIGSSLDEALLHMAARVDNRRLDSALTAVIIGRKIGGNLPRVLESTASSIREMSRLEGVVRTKTAEAKMQLYVIGAAPFFLIAALSTMSPGYFEPFQESPLGYLIALAAGACWLLAVYLARQVLSVSL